MTQSEPCILLFDGVCNLCNNTIRFVGKRDKKGKFKLMSLQSEAGQSFLVKYNLPTRQLDSIVLIKDNHFYLRSTAVLLVLKELGGIWRLFYFFIFIPKPIRDAVYNIIAKYRYKIFGKQNTCEIL